MSPASSASCISCESAIARPSEYEKLHPILWCRVSREWTSAVVATSGGMMDWMTRMGRAGLVGMGGTLIAFVLLFAGPAKATAQNGSNGAQNDGQIQAEVAKSLDNKRFKDVKASVKNGVVTLTGTVDVYSAKLDADNRAHHRRNVKGVENQIEVVGPTIDDTTLRNKLAEKLAYDRVGYGTTAFNAFTIGVQNGVVTLGGVAYGPTDKDSAISLVSNYPGVKDVVDNIEVAPVSPMDDRIRLATARAVY